MICLRCGQCCYHRLSDGSFKPCSQLIFLKNGKTKCAIYFSRFKHVESIKGDYYVCRWRENIRINFPNCPYNSKENLQTIKPF